MLIFLSGQSTKLVNLGIKRLFFITVFYCGSGELQILAAEPQLSDKSEKRFIASFFTPVTVLGALKAIFKDPQGTTRTPLIFYSLFFAALS